MRTVEFKNMTMMNMMMCQNGGMCMCMTCKDCSSIRALT